MSFNICIENYIKGVSLCYTAREKKHIDCNIRNKTVCSEDKIIYIENLIDSIIIELSKVVGYKINQLYFNILTKIIKN